MNGDVYSFNMEVVMPTLTKTTFTIFLTNLGIKKKQQEKTPNLVKAEMQQLLYFDLLHCVLILRNTLQRYTRPFESLSVKLLDTQINC